MCEVWIKVEYGNTGDGNVHKGTKKCKRKDLHTVNCECTLDDVLKN